VFVFILIANVIAKLSGGGPEVISWYLSAPSNPHAFATQPWSVFTYMFTHQEIFHFLFNMIMLYFSGVIFIDMLGSRKFPGVYILGGLAGFLVYFASYNLFPVFKNHNGFLLGASASVMAVFVSVGTFRPQYQLNLLFFGPVKLYVLVIIYVLLDLARLGASVGDPMGNSGGWLAHIGGAGFGVLFGSSYKKNRDITGWYDRLLDRIRAIFSRKRKKKPKMKVYTATGSYRGNTATMSREDKQQKIDRILDKITKSGYESLSASEKDFLFKNSKDI
jgi:membrane associated rhomboid family serine protease